MSAIGDTILTLPVLCALREAYPRAFLGWVVERKASAVLEGHECLDATIQLERGWFTSAAAVLAARRQLQSYNFEIAIDCQSMTKTALAAWLSGAKSRIGCGGEHGRELSCWLNNRLVTPRQPHLTARSVELLTALGIACPAVRFRFPLDPEVSARVSDQLAAAGLNGQFAVINPGAGWPSRRWEMDRFARVAQELGSEHGLRSIVIWGNEREQAWATEIVASAGGPAVLAPPTTLAELAALLRHARLFLGGDAGPLHLAVAVGTPCVSLHGVTRPQDSGPYGEPHLAIQIRHEAESRRQRKRADNRLMRLITVELVLSKCAELLARTAPPCVQDDAA